MARGRLLLPVVAITVVMCHARAIAGSPSDPYDFKGIPLGISLQEFRQGGNPDGKQNSVLVCSREKKNGRPNPIVSIDPVWESAGIQRCAFIERDIGLISGLTLGKRSGSFDHAFDFVRDPVDGNARLFNILITAHVEAYEDIKESLEQKLGPMSSISTGTVTNGFGATMPQVTCSWTKSDSSVAVQSPAAQANRLMVVYVHTRLFGAAQKEISSAKRSMPNRM